MLARRTVLVAGAVGTTVALLAGCGDDEPAAAPDAERRLSGAEAELLALTRFRLHQERTVPVRLEWPGPEEADVDATLDLRSGQAWGAATWADGGESRPPRLIAWSTRTVATAPRGDDGAAAPAGPAWTTRALSTGVPQDLFFLLALSLGTDRPENPVLLRQGSARFLRRDEVAGRPVTVFSGPRPADEGDDAAGSRTRYWVDDDGALQRFEAYLGDARGDLARLTRGEGAPDVPDLAARAAEVLAAGGTPAG